MEAYFNNATAAGRHMVAAGSGVLLTLTAQAGRAPYANTGGFGGSCAAIGACGVS